MLEALSPRVGERRIAVLAAPPGPQTALVFHHGTPGMALPWRPLEAAAAAEGLRLVCATRPGYTGSDRHQGRTVADAATDVEELLEHLGVERLVTAGWSGGGPHALACGALLGERCAGVATIGGVAPYGVDGLDWLAGMGPENREEMGLALEGGRGLMSFLEAAARVLRDIDAPGVAAAMGGLVSEPDRACLHGEFAEYCAALLARSVASGVEGWCDDDRAFVRPWGFDLAAIRCPVTVWRAEADLMVPPAHGDWLASHIPGATGALVQGEGHLSLLAHRIGEIVAALADQARA